MVLRSLRNKNSEIFGYVEAPGNTSLIWVRNLTVQEHLEGIFNLIAQSMDNKRVSINQLDLPEIEWDLIAKEHFYLLQQTKQEIAHLATPMQPPFFRDLPDLPKKTLQNLRYLQKMQNCEALALYSCWLNSEMEIAIHDFLPDAIDEYQLEARLKDFGHEVFSFLLRSLCQKIRNLVTDIGTLEEKKANTTDRFELEKQLFQARNQLQINVSAQYELIKEIDVGLQKIDAFHPELLRLKAIVPLAKKLFSTQLENESELDFGQQNMLIQLLNDLLGITSIVSSNSGTGILNIMFSLRLALKQMKEQASFDVLVDLVVHWKETLCLYYATIKESGKKDLRDLLQAANASENEKKRLGYAVNLLNCLVDNLLALAQFNPSKPSRQEMEKNSKMNLEFLEFIPIFYQGKDRAKPIKLVETDPLSGKPTGLTVTGYRLLISVLE